MKVLYIKKDEGNEKAGTFANVADGYARNYLIPRGIAKKVTAQVIAEYESKKAATERKIETEKAEAAKIAETINNKTIVIKAKTGEKENKLFGAVTSNDIAEAIFAEFGVRIDRKKIQFEGNIHHIGNYSCTIKLFPDISAMLFIDIISQ
jgi:large subunit ribosomal protein L9